MEPRVYDEIAGLEDWHWWFVGTRLALLDRVSGDLSPGMRIFDAGCGSGAMMRELARRGHTALIGADVSMLALKHAAPTSPGPLLACSLTQLPFPTASFDAIVCTDVL